MISRKQLAYVLGDVTCMETNATGAGVAGLGVRAAAAAKLQQGSTGQVREDVGACGTPR